MIGTAGSEKFTEVKGFGEGKRSPNGLAEKIAAHFLKSEESPYDYVFLLKDGLHTSSIADVLPFLRCADCVSGFRLDEVFNVSVPVDGGTGSLKLLHRLDASISQRQPLLLKSVRKLKLVIRDDGVSIYSQESKDSSCRVDISCNPMGLRYVPDASLFVTWLWAVSGNAGVQRVLHALPLTDREASSKSLVIKYWKGFVNNVPMFPRIAEALLQGNVVAFLAEKLATRSLPFRYWVGGGDERSERSQEQGTNEIGLISLSSVAACLNFCDPDDREATIRLLFRMFSTVVSRSRVIRLVVHSSLKVAVSDGEFVLRNA